MPRRIDAVEPARVLVIGGVCTPSGPSRSWRDWEGSSISIQC